MYRAFVVDDEETTRKGIMQIITSQNWEIDVVGEAADGAEAIGRIFELKPDVVITDVKMPIMDGVELARQIRERDADIKILFISGYDDTEYLKSALKLDAIDYILKPVNVEELKMVIKKVLNIIETEHQERTQSIEMNRKLQQSMPLLKDRFLSNLVKNVFKKESQLEKQISFLELDLPVASDYCVIIVQLDDYAQLQEELTEHDRQLLSFGILNICEEIIQENIGGYMFENNIGEFVGILKFTDEFENDKLYPIINEIKNSLYKYMDIKITVGVGSSEKGLIHACRSYRSACTALNHKLYLGKNMIITYDKTVKNGRANGEFRFDNDMIEDIRALLDVADKSKTGAFVESFFRELAGYELNQEVCRNICSQLIILGESVLLKNGVDVRDDMRAYQMMSEAAQYDTLQDMSGFIVRYYRRVCDEINEFRNTKTTNVVDIVKDEINHNYAENLTVTELANRVYLTPTYLCLLFRQETGVTINDYLTKVRIERAKELLMDLKNKIYDISYMVGYANPSYFSLQFKKFVGMGPREFRESAGNAR